MFSDLFAVSAGEAMGFGVGGRGRGSSSMMWENQGDFLQHMGEKCIRKNIANSWFFIDWVDLCEVDLHA